MRSVGPAEENPKPLTAFELRRSKKRRKIPRKAGRNRRRCELELGYAASAAPFGRAALDLPDQPSMTVAGVSADSLEQFAERSARLYTLPAVAWEVLQLTEQPRVDVAALGRCIENDPALTAKLLRVVNSALFGLSRPVGDLNQALALLGIEPLKLLVLGFNLPHELFANLNQATLCEFWTRALTEALAARELAELVQPSLREEAFLCGLLHDLGMLVLLEQLGEPYLAMLGDARTNGHDPRHVEAAALGFDRTALSARLLGNWRMPASITAAVQQSRNEPPVSDPLAVVVYLAHLLADVLAGSSEKWDELRLSTARLAGGDQYDLASIMASVELRLPVLAEALGLSCMRGEAAQASNAEFDLRQLEQAAHARLMELTERAAVELARNGRAAPALESHDALLAAAERLGRSARGELASPKAVRPAAPTVELVAEPQPKRAEVRGKPGGELLQRLRLELDACRRARVPLALALIHLDQYETLLLGAAGSAEQASSQLAAALRRQLEEGETLHGCGDGCYALLIPERSRADAVSLIRRRLLEITSCGTPASTLSAGVAWIMTPAPRFPAERLLEAARGCLSAVQLSGGNSVKSIDVL